MTTTALSPIGRPRLSVAMCTYNGAEFLPAQLQSLQRQALKPDELIVFDDCSADNSVAILKSFSESASFPVRINVLSENIGSREAFSKCIAACSGDVIVLADQDDVWMPEKLNHLTDALVKYPDAAFTFSDAVLVDRNLEPLSGRLWQRVGLGSSRQAAFLQRRGFDVLLQRPVVTGATMCFRACYRPLLLPVPPGWIHDAWISLLLAAVSLGIPLSTPLIRYRLHSQQQIGVEPHCWQERIRQCSSLTAEDYRLVAQSAVAAAERLEQFAGDEAADCAAVLRRKANHFAERALSVERRPPAWARVLRELLRGNYHRFSLGCASAMRDLLILTKHR